jgi:hypothetical protein
MKPGTERILLLLIARGERGLTSLDALREEGCLRLAARVGELRAAGVDIASVTERTPSGKHVARYRIVPPKQGSLWP